MINVGRLKQSLQGLNDKQNKTIPLAQLPQDFSTLLSYQVTDPLTEQPVTKYFKEGDRVIVTDPENGDEEYDYLVVYTLMKLTTVGSTTTALWAPGGSGGGGGAQGKIRVDLTAIVNGSQAAASNLNGVTITLRNTTDDEQVGQPVTWAGQQIVFSKLTPLKAYRISVSSKTGWKRDYEYQDIASLDIAADITKTFEFSALEYTVEMTSNQDVAGTPDADIDRTSTGVYLTARYSYGGSTVSFGSNLHHGDTVKVPSDVDTSTIEIVSSSNVAGYAKQAGVDTVNKKLAVAYSTTIVYASVSSNQSSAVLSGVVCKVDGAAVSTSVGKKVPTGSSFTFATENDLAGYQRVVTNDGTASGTSQIVGVAYNAELVSVALAADTGSPDFSGVTINIHDASDDSVIATGTGSITNQPIASGTSYYVGVTGSVSGYGNPSNTTPRTAGSSANASSSVTLTYVYGVLVIELSNSDADDTDLAKAKVYITIGSGSEQEISGTIASHVKTFSQSVQPGTTYSLRFGDVTGYATPAAMTGQTKGSGVETIQKAYNTTLLSVALASDTGEADLTNVTVTVTDTTASATVTKSGNVYKIPRGNGYSVAVSDDVDGYKAPAAATGTASGATASVTMTYEENKGVDLGLPSGLLWAGGNLVKDSQGNYSVGEETDWGTYVSWGNIIGHNEGEGYNFDQTTYDSTPGKQVAANIPSNDAAHDIALATLGSPWHLPTKEDFKELYDNTDSEWVADYNGTGVAGYKFMKKTDHSVYVFFPASGLYSGTSLSYRGTYGHCWSSSFLSATSAYYLRFNSSSVLPQDYYNRRYGFTVRPVQYPSSSITFRLSSTDGSSVSGLTIEVTDKACTHTLTTDANGEATAILANGTATISVNGKASSVSSITVSGTATVNISVSPILYAYIKFDQTKSDDTQMITVSETLNGTAQTLNPSTGKHANAALQAIRDSSHLYMGKFGNGTMALRQLKDDDGTKYADDNSNANMDGTDGDHYLRINAPFYIKRVSGSNSGDTVVYGVAVGGKPDSTWKQVISPNDLLGVHEAIASDTGNNTNGVLYSKSGADSTGNISQANFKQKARNKGTGFSLVTWEWHNIMAMLFYGWYGRTNAQAQCGSGASAYSGATRYTGLKDSLGMTDTDSTNGNTDNTKFWGIENWWGCKYEWVDNVVVDARVWKVTDKNGTQRTAGTGASTSNCIQKMLLSENLDMIPTAVVSDSNYTTYYCDRYTQSADNSRVVARSFSNAYAHGGVACVYAFNDSSYTNTSFGSRLAFNGTIVEASVMKLRFKTSNNAAVVGAAVTVTTPTGTESHVTDSNGEVTIFTLAGSTCTVSSKVYNFNVSQFTVVAGTTVAITATELPLTTGYIILDQTSSDPTTKVLDEDGHTYSNYTRPSVIDSIRAASHCYVGTFANNKMTLKQLSDSNGTLYADGTSAATDIATTGKDVFMRLPFFFTRVSEYATDKIKIEFAFDAGQTATSTRQPTGNGWKQWGGNDLIGKYEAYETNSMTYSVSGQTSTGNVSQANFKSHARARGTGFSIVKWRHQNIMAILFYAYYGHTNCQSLIGSGASSNNKQTGLKNSLGMTDTTSSNGNTDNIVFWGLENWWGNKYEWVDNVVVDNHTWTITEDDGTTRTIQASAMASGNDAWIYPSKFILGDDLDVIAAAGQTGGSDSTGYCDGQYYTSSSSRVVARSSHSASANGGVAYVNANNDSSNTNTNNGSRLDNRK